MDEVTVVREARGLQCLATLSPTKGLCFKLLRARAVAGRHRPSGLRLVERAVDRRVFISTIRRTNGPGRRIWGGAARESPAPVEAGKQFQRIIEKPALPGSHRNIHLQRRAESAARRNDIGQAIHVGHRAALARLENHRHRGIAGIGFAIAARLKMFPRAAGPCQKRHSGADHGIRRRRRICYPHDDRLKCLARRYLPASRHWLQTLVGKRHRIGIKSLAGSVPRSDAGAHLHRRCQFA